MISYSEFRSYSAAHDDLVTRLSVPDELGQEYFTMIVGKRGKDYRKARDAFIEVIADIFTEPKLEKRTPPGEVTL